MKFADIHEALVQKFPNGKISNTLCGQIVQEAFPETKRTRVGKQRLVYVVGIEETLSCADSTDTLQAENIQLKK